MIWGTRRDQTGAGENDKEVPESVCMCLSGGIPPYPFSNVFDCICFLFLCVLLHSDFLENHVKSL